MDISISTADLKTYVARQIGHFFPDGRGEVSGRDVESALTLALERCEYCFSRITYYRIDNETVFSHLHGDQYATFLYFFANSLWELSENRIICDKLLQLNRVLHGIFISYKCELPRIFFLDHPVGTVIGNAVYSDYLIILQNVTVNTQDKFAERPRIGKRVFLSAGAKITGSPVVGSNVVIGVGTMIHNVDIPDGSIAYTDRDNGKLMVRPYNNKWRFTEIFLDN